MCLCVSESGSVCVYVCQEGLEWTLRSSSVYVCESAFVHVRCLPLLCVCLCVPVCLCVCGCASVFACVSACMCVCVCVYVRVFECVPVCYVCVTLSYATAVREEHFCVCACMYTCVSRSLTPPQVLGNGSRSKPSKISSPCGSGLHCGHVRSRIRAACDSQKFSV